MKKLIAISVFTAFIMGVASNASASWWGSNDDECWGPYGKIPDCNPYDEWDPRYWMQEMEDAFDDNDDDYYRYGGYGRGYGAPGYGYGAPAYGYGAPGYGYGAPAPAPAYGAPAPVYGAPAPAYGGYPYAAPAPAPVAPAPAPAAPAQ